MNPLNPCPLRSPGPHLGTWLSIGSPVVAELAAECGFAWLLFDLEHGCGSESDLLGQFQAIRGTGVAAVVRLGAPHPDAVCRALDRGADGLMLPHVSSAAEAEGLVRAAHYPPRGSRGVSRTVRAFGYGLRAPASMAGVAPPFLIAQIETLEGVGNAEAIARVDGIDALFVGPADLRFDVEVRADGSEAAFDRCVAGVATATAAAGKACGILAREPGQVDDWIRRGFNLVAVDSDLAILRRGYLSVLGRRG